VNRRHKQPAAGCLHSSQAAACRSVTVLAKATYLLSNFRATPSEVISGPVAPESIVGKPRTVVGVATLIKVDNSYQIIKAALVRETGFPIHTRGEVI